MYCSESYRVDGPIGDRAVLLDLLVLLLIVEDLFRLNAALGELSNDLLWVLSKAGLVLKHDRIGAIDD